MLTDYANDPPNSALFRGQSQTKQDILLPVSREDSSFGDWMVELVNAIHEVFPGQSKTVTFTIPAPAK